MPFASADGSGSAHVGFFGALGITFQQSRRIVPAARRNRMQRHTTIQPQRFVRAAEIVLAKSAKPSRRKIFLIPRVVFRGLRRLVGENALARLGELGNIKRIVGQLHQRKVDRCNRPSGTPATKRKCFSRSTRKSANNSSSMTKVRLPRAVFGSSNLVAYFFVCSSAR
jgi:hypothetical protein